MSTDGGDGGDKPAKPDPFAPLPLANLPPVRRRGEPEPVEEAPPPPPVEAPAATVEPEPLPYLQGPEAWVGDVAPSTPSGPSVASAAEALQPPLEAPAEAPLLPVSYSENELRMAVGATPIVDEQPKKRRGEKRASSDGDDDDERAGKRSRRTALVAALSIFVGGGIAALVFLGKAHSAHYYIACESDRVVVEQGRSFPPWGTAPLSGPEWQPLKIPPEASCQPQETEDRADLAKWYLKVLVDQATAFLTAREVTKVDDAEAVLKQALLVTRELRTDDDAKNARDAIKRLLGDVTYWRAAARVKSASDTLAEAAKLFDAAGAQTPAHFTDWVEWSAYVRKVSEQLRALPAPNPAQSPYLPIAPARPTAPPGVELPPEPAQGSGAGSDEPAPIAAPDAGVASGGVLL